MFQDAYKKLDEKAAEDLLKKINPKLDISPFDPKTTQVMTYDLSFYPGYKFVEMTDHSISPPVQAMAIYKDEDIHILNWSNEPFYTLNAKVPIHLNEDNVAKYVKFFFTYVRGRHGRFLIAETVDDIEWKDDPAPAARKAIGKMLDDIRISARDEDGTFHLNAHMMFKNSLFQSTIVVKPDGSVSLMDEELLVEDMPVIDDTLGQ